MHVPRGKREEHGDDICGHCTDGKTTKSNCFRHCHEILDGRHSPNYKDASIAEASEIRLVIDVPCVRCCVTGSFVVDSKEVQWA